MSAVLESEKLSQEELNRDIQFKMRCASQKGKYRLTAGPKVEVDGLILVHEVIGEFTEEQLPYARWLADKHMTSTQTARLCDHTGKVIYPEHPRP